MRLHPTPPTHKLCLILPRRVVKNGGDDKVDHDKHDKNARETNPEDPTTDGQQPWGSYRCLKWPTTWVCVLALDCGPVGVLKRKDMFTLYAVAVL